MARDAFSDLETSEDLAADTANGDERPLADGEVRLRDGTRVLLRETNGLDDEANEKLLSRMGYVVTGMGALSYGRAMALLAIEAIDGQPVLRPRTKRDLDDLLLRFKSRDHVAISSMYAQLNGLTQEGQGDDTFR